MPKQAVLGISQAVPCSACVNNVVQVTADTVAAHVVGNGSLCRRGCFKMLAVLNSSVGDLARFQRAVSVMIWLMSRLPQCIWAYFCLWIKSHSNLTKTMKVVIQIPTSSSGNFWSSFCLPPIQYGSSAQDQNLPSLWKPPWEIQLCMGSMQAGNPECDL